MPTQDVKLPGWLQISEAAHTLAHTLLERYPAAFRADPAGVRPLKIRIDRDIRQALGVSRQVVSEVLSGYKYLYKFKFISFLCRAKRWCRMYRVRHQDI